MYKTGLIFSPPDERDYPVSALLSVESKFEHSYDIPGFSKVPVYDQGNINSCGAHAVCTEREHVEADQTGTFIPLSKGAVYGNRVQGDYMGEGLIMRTTFQRLQDRGIPKYEIFPENIEVPEVIDLYYSRFAEIITDGKPRRITSYALARSPEEIKSCLKLGFPIIIGIDVYKGLFDLTPENSILPLPEGQNYGGHAMVLFGWDDDKGWHVRNSWGSDFGDNGNLWIPYEYQIREAWLIVDELIPITKSRRYDRTIKKIVVHHMGDGKGTDVSITSRWNPYGYEYPEYDIGIEGNGKVIQGRPLSVIGSHSIATYQKYLTGDYYDTSGEDNWWNKNSIGIGLAGDFTMHSMPEAMFSSLVELTMKLMKQYGLTPADVLPHREITSTACPGNSWSWDKFIEEISKGVNQMEVAVVYWSARDYSVALLVANKLGSCGMFCRNEVATNIQSDAKNAKRLINIGGPEITDHPNVVNKCGSGAADTAILAAEYANAL